MRTNAAHAGRALERMASPAVLWSAWSRVAAGSGMPGADGVDTTAFARNLGPRLDRLAHLLRTGRYQPQPLRLVTAVRAGKQRRRGLPTVCDRVAQRAFLDICGNTLDADNAEISFAYRRGRSWLDALAQAGQYRDAGLRWVVRADIADFFDSIDRTLLDDVLASRLPDPAAASLAQGWAAAPLLTETGLRPRPRGIPEGAPMSPALANAFLHNFDNHVHGRHGRLIRYADDIGIFCPGLESAVAAVRDAAHMLGSSGLRLNTDKTYIATFDAGFSLLGWVFHGDHGWPEQENRAWTHPLTRLSGITAKGVQ